MGVFADWFAQQTVPDCASDGAWLRGPQGQALSRAMATEIELQNNLLRQGLLARFPAKGNTDTVTKQYGLPPSDALDQIGADRLLPRGPGESDATYSARLLAAWAAWEFAGSHYGVLRALNLAGYANMVIVQDNGRYSQLTGSAGDITDLTFGTLMTCVNRGGKPGWTFDTRVDFYSRFAIVFTADASNLSTDAGQKTLVSIVNNWKPAKAQFVAAYVILSGRLFGWPIGRTLGADPNLGGNSVRVIAGDGSGPTVIGP